MATSDENALLNVFPSVVWTVILGNVTKAKEYQKICGSSSFLESFLKPRCTQILFPEVAKLLVERYEYSRYAVYTQEVRNCREVCRAWKTGMDHVLQNPVWYSRFPIGWTYAELFEENFSKELRDKFEDPTDFEKFQEHFEKTHSEGQINPFVSREICFVVNDDPSWESYCLAWAELLEKYGRHIWYCEIQFELRDRHEPDLVLHLTRYTKLVQMLEVMPHLKSLELLLSCSESATKLLLDNSDAANKIRFPSFPNLHFLRLDGVPLPFVRKIVELDKQVGNVDARDATGDELKIYCEEIPALTRLAVNIEDKETLEIVGDTSMNCKIDTLRMDASMAAASWDAIFGVLETKFADNLTKLILNLPLLPIKMTRQKGLSLPKLAVRNAVPFDFLLEMASTLQRLYVQTNLFVTGEDVQKVKDQEDVVKLYQFWETPYKSNVWRLFPKLQHLKTRLWSVTYAATRADWEKYETN